MNVHRLSYSLIGLFPAVESGGRSPQSNLRFERDENDVMRLKLSRRFINSFWFNQQSAIYRYGDCKFAALHNRLTLFHVF
jgi:hypothetical protein